MIGSFTTGGPITIENNKVAVVVSGQMGPPGTSLISRMTDVNIDDIDDGSVLVYKGNTKQWTATKNLHSQDMDAGEF